MQEIKEKAVWVIVETFCHNKVDAAYDAAWSVQAGGKVRTLAQVLPTHWAGLLITMIHTDTRYAQPTVFKLTTSLRDKYIQLDTHGDVSKMESITGKIGNMYMRVASYVSNDAAVYENMGWGYHLPFTSTQSRTTILTQSLKITLISGMIAWMIVMLMTCGLIWSALMLKLSRTRTPNENRISHNHHFAGCPRGYHSHGLCQGHARQTYGPIL